jgi:histone H3/H4
MGTKGPLFLFCFFPCCVLCQHPGESVAVVARELGKQWATMSATDKEKYQLLAAAEREQVTKDTEAWLAAGGVVPEPMPATTTTPTADSMLSLPLTKIRKICKLDPEVKGLSREALLLVTKMAELTTVKLAKECVKVAAIQNRRKLLPDDVAQVCGTRTQFLFLREDIQDLKLEQQKLARQKQQQQHAVGDPGDHEGNTNAVLSKNPSKKELATAGTKPLTAYFGMPTMK